jgi:hypothetical protein
MKRSGQWIRLGLIAAASFVLLVTVLPQVASGIGLRAVGARLAASVSCSGSSGGSSSSQCGPGTVTGSVTIAGAPAGFTPAFLGAGACPAGTTTGVACADPQYTLAEGGSYSLSLTPGSWEVSGFYENNGFGGVFLSPPTVVTVPSGGTVTANFVVTYQAPATVQGQVKVTGVPSGVSLSELSVLLCPSFAPYAGGSPSIACVTSYSPTQSGVTSASYQVSGLPPGTWTVYPSYCTQFDCATNAAAGKVVQLVSAHTTRASVRTPFIVPGDGLLSATVTVTGAPTGFTDPVGLAACQAGSCQTFTDLSGGSTTLLLAVGTWTVHGLYLASPFDNAIAGPSQTVTISGGHTTTVPLSVPYQLLGTASGTIRVTGNQQHVPVTSYTVSACPVAVSGSLPSPCIDEYSGPTGYGFGASITSAAANAKGAARSPVDLYDINTLTPGTWTLYPGYGTALGSYTDPVGTDVTIVAGQTTSRPLTVPFQAPTLGAVTGKVVVIGAPANGFEAGVQACTAPPSGTSCPGEQDAYSQADGRYSLALPPGTWWLSGFVDLFTGLGFGESTSAPEQVSVVPGSHSKLNFRVDATTS